MTSNIKNLNQKNFKDIIIKFFDLNKILAIETHCILFLLNKFIYSKKPRGFFKILNRILSLGKKIYKKVIFIN